MKKTFHCHWMEEQNREVIVIVEKREIFSLREVGKVRDPWITRISGNIPQMILTDAIGWIVYLRGEAIGVARRAKGAMPPIFLNNIVIFCFERRLSKQNSAIRLKSNILAPLNFWAGYATGHRVPQTALSQSFVVRYAPHS